ncbi:hypothetical protein GCM10009858_40570 [Terrabacter carboxydivorans]|uniref:Uncharacterized protein n=1 Tax=Terrabacter carboxydivorans TaxID=619730 RepID=A0ABN3M9X1_9MICO
MVCPVSAPSGRAPPERRPLNPSGGPHDESRHGNDKTPGSKGAGGLGDAWSRLSESNRRPIHYEFVLDPISSRARAEIVCHLVLVGMAAEGGRGHVGGTRGADGGSAGLRIDRHPAPREGAAQKALDRPSRAGRCRQVAVEVGSGPPWERARAATAGASLVQAPESGPQVDGAAAASVSSGSGAAMPS